MLKMKERLPKKIKWGAAGCGNFTERTFLPALKQIGGAKLVSIYSSSSERAKMTASKFGAQYNFSDFDEFLKSDIDAVYIGGANNDRYWQTLKAARAGKHILCDKPIALNSKEAAEMVKVCKENNSLLAVNYLYRAHPLITKAKEIIDKGMIGRLTSINLNFNVDYAPNDNFRFDKSKSGGGVLRDLGTHMIDLLRYFGGEISDINGFMDNIVYKSQVEDFAAAIVKFSNGGYGYFNVSYNNKKAFNRIDILGYNGCLSVENLIGKRNNSAKLLINLCGETKKAFRKRANKMLYMLKSIHKSLKNNLPPPASGNDGLINLQLMEKLEGG